MSVLPIFYAIVSARYFLTAWLLCASDGSGGVSMKFCCFAPCNIGALIAATTTIANCRARQRNAIFRSEEHTSELQSLMRISYAGFCLKKKTQLHHNIIII